MSLIHSGILGSSKEGIWVTYLDSSTGHTVCPLSSATLLLLFWVVIQLASLKCRVFRNLSPATQCQAQLLLMTPPPCLQNQYHTADYQVSCLLKV